MNSAESKVFPTAPVGAPRGAAPVELPQHQTFQRQVAVYIPAGYTPNTPAPFIVVQDGPRPRVTSISECTFRQCPKPSSGFGKASAACGRNQRGNSAGRALSAFSRQPAVLFLYFCNFSAFRGEVTDKESISRPGNRHADSRSARLGGSVVRYSLRANVVKIAQPRTVILEYATDGALELRCPMCTVRVPSWISRNDLPSVRPTQP
jgi:hypothetical protein